MINTIIYRKQYLLMNNKHLKPKDYSQSLKAITPMSLKGQEFINEATQFIARNPFTHNVANNMIEHASKIPDTSIQNWATAQRSRIDENHMSFQLGMICESAKYTSNIFTSFKSVAGELIEMSESDIVRAVAVDGVLDKYSVIAEISTLIAKAKNLSLAQSGISAQTLTWADKSNLKPVISLSTQIAVDEFLVGFDGNILAIINESTNKVRLGKYTDVMASLDTENFVLDYDGFMTSLQQLQILMPYYDVDMQSFVLNIVGNKVIWRLADNAITLNGEVRTYEEITQVILAKATAMSSKSSTAIADNSDILFSALSILWVVRESIYLSDIIACYPNSDGNTFVMVNENRSLVSRRPYTYTCFSKFGATGNVMISEYDTYSDFAKQFLNSFVHNTLNKVYEAEIKAENAFMLAVLTANQMSNDNIVKLSEQRQVLVDAKASLPASSLEEVNSKIMTIDDLIQKNKNSLVTV